MLISTLELVSQSYSTGQGSLPMHRLTEREGVEVGLMSGLKRYRPYSTFEFFTSHAFALLLS